MRPLTVAHKSLTISSIKKWRGYDYVVRIQSLESIKVGTLFFFLRSAGQRCELSLNNLPPTCLMKHLNCVCSCHQLTVSLDWMKSARHHCLMQWLGRDCISIRGMELSLAGPCRCRGRTREVDFTGRLTLFRDGQTGTLHTSNMFLTDWYSIYWLMRLNLFSSSKQILQNSQAVFQSLLCAATFSWDLINSRRRHTGCMGVDKNHCSSWTRLVSLISLNFLHPPVLSASLPVFLPSCPLSLFFCCMNEFWTVNTSGTRPGQAILGIVRV